MNDDPFAPSFRDEPRQEPQDHPWRDGAWRPALLWLGILVVLVLVFTLR